MKICIPIKQNSFSLLLSDLKRAQGNADVIEIWFDEINDLSEKNIKLFSKHNAKPLIYKVTKYIPSRVYKLLKTLKKISFIDLDIDSDPQLIGQVKRDFPKLKIILSYHDFKKTPPAAEIMSIIEKMIALKADIIKIASKAQSLGDSLSLLSILSQISKNHKAIFISMGRHGRITRTAGHLLGNYLMYAPMRKEHKTAPGQITLDELRKILKYTKKSICL